MSYILLNTHKTDALANPITFIGVYDLWEPLHFYSNKIPSMFWMKFIMFRRSQAKVDLF